MGRRSLGAGIAGLVMLGAAALAATSPGAAPIEAAQETPRFVISGYMFSPTTLTVKVGTRVVWVNQDEEPHNVVSDEGLFRSAGLDTDESFAYTFERPGTYRFLCSIHPRMTGTIVVQ